MAERNQDREQRTPSRAEVQREASAAAERARTTEQEGRERSAEQMRELEAQQAEKANAASNPDPNAPGMVGVKREEGQPLTDEGRDEQARERAAAGAANLDDSNRINAGLPPLDPNADYAPPPGVGEDPEFGGGENRGGRAGSLFAVQPTYPTFGQRDIMASTVGMRTDSLTFLQSGVSADANGDRILWEGTVIQLSSGKGIPRTSGTAVGILRRRLNLRDGDMDAAIVVAGAVREDKCVDNGVFGTVESGSKTDLPFIQFTTHDF